MDTGEVDRRRYRRVALRVPIVLRGLEEGMRATGRAGLTENISLAGVYLRTPKGKPVAKDDLVTLSISIPQEAMRQFPFSRLMGRGRIVRVEELPEAGKAETNRLGMAVEFAEDFTVLSAAPPRP